MCELLAKICRSVLRVAGHDVRGADGAAQAQGLLPADDAEGFFCACGPVVHPGQEVAVRIYPAGQVPAEGEAGLEEIQHLGFWILNFELKITNWELRVGCGFFFAFRRGGFAAPA